MEAVEQPINSEFYNHIEGFLDSLIGWGIDLNDRTRSVHEYGRDLGNHFMEHRLEVASLGFDPEKNEGVVSIWNQNRGETKSPTALLEPTKEAYVKYSLKGGKTHVESVTFWPTFCPSTETDSSFLERIGPQFDAMVQKGKEVRQNQSPQQ